MSWKQPGIGWGNVAMIAAVVSVGVALAVGGYLDSARRWKRHAEARHCHLVYDNYESGERFYACDGGEMVVR